jgi:hypothetical protein
VVHGPTFVFLCVGFFMCLISPAKQQNDHHFALSSASAANSNTGGPRDWGGSRAELFDVVGFNKFTTPQLLH